MTSGEVKQNYELAYEDYRAGMKYKEIADKYGVTVNTVKSWKTRYKWCKDDKKVCTQKPKKCAYKKTQKENAEEAGIEEVKQVIENPDLTDKQRKFCDEYLIDCNATRAYKAAYPNVKKDSSAAVCAAKLLRIAKVQEYINQQLDKISSEKTADAKEVMEYLTSVMRGESQAEIVVIEGTGDGCSDARRMSKAPDEKERLKAAELLGRRYGLFKENVNLEVEPVVLVNDLKE